MGHIKLGEKVMKNISITIEFGGFYGSIWEWLFDSWVEQEMYDIPDEYRDEFCDRAIHESWESYKQRVTENAWSDMMDFCVKEDIITQDFYDRLTANAPVKSTLNNPREYNFETDVVICEFEKLPDPPMTKEVLAKWVSEEVLESITEACKTSDGYTPLHNKEDYYTDMDLLILAITSYAVNHENFSDYVCEECNYV